MKSLSCGVIITDGVSFLIGRANSDRWDIPKGGIEKDETEIDCVIRETKEEVGLELERSNLIPLGKFKYRSIKDLVLFKYTVNELPKIEKMCCSTTHYIKKFNIYLPEFLEFKYIKKNEMSLYLIPKLVKILENIL